MSSLNTTSDLYAPRLLDNLHDIPYSIFEHLLNPESVLRPKQREATEITAQRIFEDQLRAIALIMPTSTGKTVILAQAIEALQQDELIGRPPKKVLIITDTKEGILQTQQKLKLFADIDCGLYYQDEKNLDSPVIATTYHSWQSEDFPIDPEDVDMVILDEAHEAISNARLEKLKQHKNAVWFALTASPTYSQERSVLQHFALGYRMTMEEAVHHKLASSIRNVVLKSNIDVDLDAIRIRGKDLDKKLLSKILNIKARNRIGSEYLLFGRHFDTGESIRNIQGIVSCFDVKHAEKFANDTNALYEHFYPGSAPEHGFIRVVSGKTENRRDILKWHKEGKIRYLAYADLLNQNYDDCGIGVCLNLRPTKSWVLATQRGGRPGRLDELNPGKIALVVDIYDRYKGKRNKQPLVYSHAIGASAIITEEARLLAEKEKITKKYNVMDRSQISEVEAFVQNIEFNLVTDEESIFSLSTPEEEVREKTEDDLSIPETAKLCELGQDAIMSGLKNLLEDCRLHDNEPETYAHPGVSTETVQTKQGMKILTIPRDHLETFKEKYLPILKLRIKEEDDLTALDVAKVVPIKARAIYFALEELREQWAIYERTKNERFKPKMPIEIVRNGGKASVSIKRDQLQEFIIHNEWHLRDKTEADISLIDIEKLLGMNRSTVQKGLRRLEKDWKQHKQKPELHAEPTIPMERVRCSNGAITVIPRECIQEFKGKYIADLDLRDKEDNDLVLSDLMRLTNFGRKKVSLALRILKAHWAEYDSATDKKEKPLVALEMVKLPKGMSAVSIRLEQLDLFKTEYLSDKYSLPENAFSKRKSNRKNLQGLRSKTDEEILLSEIGAMTSLGRKPILARIHKIISSWKAYAADTKNIAKPEVSVSRVKEKDGSAGYAIPKSQLNIFIEKHLPKVVSQEDYLTVTQLMHKTNLSRSTIGNSLAQLRKENVAHKADSQNHPKPEVEVEEVVIRDKKSANISAKQPQLAIKKSQYDLYCNVHLKNLLDVVGALPEKSDQDLTLKDMIKYTQSSEWAILRGINQLKDEWEAHKQDASINKMPAVELHTVKYLNKPATAIKKKDFVAFVKGYLPLYGIKEKTDADYGAPDIVKMTGLDHSTILKSFNKILDQKKVYEKTGQEQDKPKVDLVQVKRSNNIHWAVPKDQLETYKSEYLKDNFLPKKQNHQLTMNDIADLFGIESKYAYRGFETYKKEMQKGGEAERSIEINKVKVFRNETQYKFAFAIEAKDVLEFVQKFVPKAREKFVDNQEEILNQLMQRAATAKLEQRPEID